MTDTVMRVDGVGKRYVLGASTGASSYRSLREELSRGLRRVQRTSAEVQDRTLWALRNVSFEVRTGERVGIIGRNGAGKSTLLKVLSQVTAPSEGRLEIRGRVGALLEVGTGFHPELSGRDNILLNGAILGMGRREIRSKIDEIVDFAGVERFLDTPVKRYSSGMYLRLAFAVAAHLEPDLLLVDEVLAVGDAEFQRKCLGRMEAIGASGRTVLFVSHSLPSILRLCDRVILLDSGGVVVDGSPQEVIRAYLDSGLGSAAERIWDRPDEAPGDEVVRLRSVRIRSQGQVTEEVDIRCPVQIEVEYSHLHPDPALRPTVNLHFSNEEGTLLFLTNDANNLQWRSTPRSTGVVRAVCTVPGNFLAEGRHFVVAAVSTFNPTRVHVFERDAVSFHVVDRSEGDGVRGEYANEYPGVVRPMLDWEVTNLGDPTRTADLASRAH
jgi:lipopolysaccharide transport system ATP-binding protein